jgi:flavin reductase (DIM6/NTAB) family NADH-FMN oxidoreductase RutF
MRSEFEPAADAPRDFYRLLTALVTPRPIAWVSSRSPEGVDNLAPHSFFTVVCADPPMVAFSSVGRKDTLRNVTATGEFVVNLTSAALTEQVNLTGTDFPAELSEFDTVGLRREPSARVAPPRVADAPAVLECVVHTLLELGDSTLVIGRVLTAAVAEEVLVDGHPDISLLRPMARLGRDEWSEIGAVRSLSRVRYQDWADSADRAGDAPDASGSREGS